MEKDRYSKSLTHAQGREWQDHKYIRKEGNRYIYKDDKSRGTRKSFVTSLLSTLFKKK